MIWGSYMQGIRTHLVRACEVVAHLFTALLTSSAISGCATSLERHRAEAEQEFERRAAEFNFVAIKTGANGQSIMSGGTVFGTLPFSTTEWREIVKARHENLSLSILVPAGYMTGELSGWLSKPQGGASKFDEALIRPLKWAGEFADIGAPQMDLSFRLVPPRARFRHEANHRISADMPLTAEFVAALPGEKESVDLWLDALVRKVIHESYHVARKKHRPPPIDMTTEEEEVIAYTVEHCSAILARGEIPRAAFSFPTSLVEFVDNPSGTSISEVYRSLVDHRNQPTIVGFNVFALALHRYLQEMSVRKGSAVVAMDLRPFCMAVPRRQIRWDADDADARVRLLAIEGATKP
jgi:hypothetical protein